jgi:hypothetical protein
MTGSYEAPTPPSVVVGHTNKKQEGPTLVRGNPLLSNKQYLTKRSKRANV